MTMAVLVSPSPQTGKKRLTFSGSQKGYNLPQSLA